MSGKKLVLAKLAVATKDVAAAEHDLEKLLQDIERTSRAEKKTISAIVEDAFAKLRAARVILGDVEKLIKED